MSSLWLTSLQIGSWNWAGSQCSCGQWVAPAMQFPMSKVALALPPRVIPSRPFHATSSDAVCDMRWQVDVKGQAAARPVAQLDGAAGDERAGDAVGGAAAAACTDSAVAAAAGQ